MSVGTHFTDFFNVDPETLENYGAFNVSLINDLPLFIDPFLLFYSSKAEYQELHNQIIKYVEFLRDKSVERGINPGFLENWFYFSEVKQNWLGYSLVGNKGHGLGKDFAASLNRSLHYVFTNFGAEEITRGSHLEKLCLIKNGVGKDSISDFTTNLIKEYLLNYTQEFAVNYIAPHLRKMVVVPKVRFNYTTQRWIGVQFDLPFFEVGYERDYVILTPKDILTREDIWINRAELNDPDLFYHIAYSVPNKQLRADITHHFLLNLPPLPDNRTQKDYSTAVSSVIDQFPTFLDYYIKYKEDQGERAEQISKARVLQTQSLFVEQIKQLVSTLYDVTAFYTDFPPTYIEAMERVKFLKDVIENKGGHRAFYVNKEPIKKEEDLQIFYRLTWFGTSSSVSREVNDGRGPADYKISRGAYDNTIVEFKLARNSKLKQNLQNQTEIYQKASDADRAIKVVIYFTAQELAKVNGILDELGLTGNESVVLIDARIDNKPSGSTAKQIS
jgi:hypothetical protein